MAVERRFTILSRIAWSSFAREIVESASLAFSSYFHFLKINFIFYFLLLFELN